MRSKLKKYKKVFDFSNYNERIPPFENSSFLYKDKNNITLELGCGYGEYSIELAQHDPDKSIIGIDIKADRLYQALVKADMLKLTNSYFLRTDIRCIINLFPRSSVDNLWITFPDPFLGKVKNAIVSSRFWNMYTTILKPNGEVYLVTDSSQILEQAIIASEQEGFMVVCNSVPFIVQSRYYKSKVQNGVVYCATFKLTKYH